MKIKEVIVVEGKHDSDTIKACVECDTIETQGTHLGKGTLALIRKLQQQRGIIIFTDPDGPGEQIRHAINSTIPGCKNAFIEKNKAQTTKKVGVEHADKEDIIEALSHLMTFDADFQESISWSDFIDLGLNGQKGSSERREVLGKLLFLGKANAKTLWKRLNMLGLHKEDVEELLDEERL